MIFFKHSIKIMHAAMITFLVFLDIELMETVPVGSDNTKFSVAIKSIFAKDAFGLTKGSLTFTNFHTWSSR